MTAINTFSGQIVLLLLVATLTVLRLHGEELAEPKTDTDKHRQPMSAPTGTVLVAALCRPLLVIALLHTIRVTATTINVTIQRRHLMVWAIFAPKYVFDTCLMVVSDALILGLGAVLL